ncbi:hypothetical protein JAAARDRAFT_573448 [Jaapia argillacea MUCL 33604]|uniref:Uncharacterized protein n=1 Tax=Jaapia argillacea MUCL 33604 TaxID=933084 RepID=A0A067QCB4_9AGAM|nr:hypothetical protein JAAARDRAFT_573448 [Jaapia argillacea MUCL 33604]
MSYTPYYQLCGFQGHIPCGHQGEEQLANELGQALSHQGVLELVLGIVPTGASYVLLTEDQCFQARRHSKHGWLPHEFISLSPIIFRNAKELGSKLSTYKQKSGKKARAMFEHQRVLHCILNSNSQTPFNFSKFALPVASWARKLQFLSLTFNMWAADSRPRHEQLTGPKILDIGWSRFSISSPSPLSAAHVVVSENRKFRNRGISSVG